MDIRKHINEQIEFKRNEIKFSVRHLGKSGLNNHVKELKYWEEMLESLDATVEQAKLDTRHNTILEMKSILSIM